jgi:hypothetical protein
MPICLQLLALIPLTSLQVLNLRPLTFDLMPFGWLHYIMLIPYF